MRISWIRSALLHAKYGSGLLLFAFDLSILALFLFDVADVHHLDLDYWLLVRGESFLASFGFTSLYTFFVFFAVPIGLTIAGNFLLYKYAPKSYYRRTASSKARAWLLILHMLVASAATVHKNFVEAIRQAAGMCGPLDQGAACYSSYFSFLDDYRWGLLFLTAVVIPFASMLAKDSLYRNRELTREFAFWRIIGVAGEYQPEYGDELIYANSASMAPSIRSITAGIQAYHHAYQRDVPTSDSAKKRLRTKAGHARALLYDYLLPNDGYQQNRLSIEFFPGTSRALEAGLLRISGVTNVLFSPYEHPSQVDVARWLSGTRGSLNCSVILPPSPDFFQESWEAQRDALCSSVRDKITSAGSGKVALVLSEVHYITGIEVRVGELMERLRGEHPDLIFIIDGSQAVGNLVRPLGRIAEQMHQDDFYYFSAHKWLLSPNTCGALVHQARPKGAHPYDVFGPDLPTSTIDPNTVFGLVSALEFLFDEKRSGQRLFERFSERSRVSKDYFRILIEQGKRLEVLESVTSAINSSLYLAVRPRSGYKWRGGTRAFWDHVQKRGVDLTVIPEAKPYFDSEEEAYRPDANISDYLLRVSFPYFLTGRHVRKLVGHLDDFLIPQN